MFSWLKKQFGEGKILVEGALVDGTTFTVKIPYIGAIDTLDEDELFDKVRRDLKVNHGATVDMTTLRIVDYTI